MLPHVQKLLSEGTVSQYALGVASSLIDCPRKLIQEKVLAGEITVDQGREVMQEILRLVYEIYQRDYLVLLDTEEPKVVYEKS